MKSKQKHHRGSGKLFEKLASQAVSRQYQNGEAIYLQGDAADAMFRVETGHVKLAVASARGKKAAIAILREGDCFGESCLVGKSRRRCTASSIQQSTVGRISKRAMTRLRDDPGFTNELVSHLLLRADRLQDDRADQLLHSSERRLARLLLQLTEHGDRSGPATALVSVDQGTLAEVVGTTRSRVSHFMNQFRKKGLIDYNGTLRVHKALLTFLLSEHIPG